MKNKIVGLLPVRLASTRLPGKALKEIDGMPAIIHAYKRASLAKSLDEVYICTDSVEIQKVGYQYDCNVIMTGAHTNGSERIYEASMEVEADIIVNIQGDEVLVMPSHIDLVVNAMLSDDGVEYTLGLTNFDKQNSAQDFKGVTDLFNNLIYCSRSDIPNSSINQNIVKKVVFIVGFTRASLEQFVSWPETPLEKAEPNEFLRIIEHGHKIKTVFMENAHISLDTASDLDEIRLLMKSDPLRDIY